MMKRKSLEELNGIAAKATREALKDYYIPEEIRSQLVLGTLFEGDYRIFELYVPGGKPEDAWIISQARVHSITGDVEVEVVGLQKQVEVPASGQGKGCVECRQRVYTDLWPPPIHISVAEEVVSLHRCHICGTYWEVNPEGGRIIDEEEARRKFPEAFTKQE